MQQGWAPLMATTLAEYGQSFNQDDGFSNSRHLNAWQEIRSMPSMQQLVGLSVQLQKLLHAVDCFPRGGLCQGDQLVEALRRYETLWLPLLASTRATSGATAAEGLVPPLDVAFVWHVHRLQATAYGQDTAAVAGGLPLHPPPQQAFAFTDGSDAAGAATARQWAAAYPGEPFYPPATGAAAAGAAKSSGFASALKADVMGVAVRQPLLTHQMLRQSYLDSGFLQAALDRYAKFLLLRKARLDVDHPVPCADVALMWHTHRSISGAYAGDCMAVLGRLFEDMPGAAASAYADHGEAGPWRFHWGETRRAWQEEFKEPYLLPDTGYVPIDSFHPAQLSLRSYLPAFEDSTTAAAGGAWRAGAHALYVSWLQYPVLPEPPGGSRPQAASPPPPQPLPPPPQVKQPSSKGGGGGGLFACCFGGSDVEEPHAAAAGQYQQQQRQQQQHGTAAAAPPRVVALDAAGLQRAVSGFPNFQQLPSSSSHAYFRMFYPRANGKAPPSSKPQQEVPEIQLLVSSPKEAAAAAAEALGNGDAGEEGVAATGTSLALQWS